jgi:hypothetical protein
LWVGLWRLLFYLCISLLLGLWALTLRLLWEPRLRLFCRPSLWIWEMIAVFVTICLCSSGNRAVPSLWRVCGDRENGVFVYRHQIGVRPTPCGFRATDEVVTNVL